MTRGRAGEYTGGDTVTEEGRRAMTTQIHHHRLSLTHYLMEYSIDLIVQVDFFCLVSSSSISTSSYLLIVVVLIFSEPQVPSSVLLVLMVELIQLYLMQDSVCLLLEFLDREKTVVELMLLLVRYQEKHLVVVVC